MKKFNLKITKEQLVQWIVGLLVIVPLTVVWLYYKGKHPQLTAYGMKDFSLVCEGEGRLYRMKSKNTHVSHGDYVSKSHTSRDLLFLDPEGKILYSTSLFEPYAFDEEGVWRFRYDKRGNAINRWLFDKTEHIPPLHKLMTFLFQANWRKYKDRAPDQVLYGDEEVFDIEKNFQNLTIKRKEKQPLIISCQPF